MSLPFCIMPPYKPSAFLCFPLFFSLTLSLSLCITVSALLRSVCLCAHTYTHIHSHNPFLCNWKDALTVCHNTKMDQMAKYPWGSTSPTERIKDNSPPPPPASPCFPYLTHFSAPHTSIHKSSQGTQAGGAIPTITAFSFLCSSPLLQYECACLGGIGPFVLGEFLLHTKAGKWLLSYSITTATQRSMR